MIAAISGPVVAAINAKKDVAITNIDAAKDITINAQNNATKKELATDAAQVALVQAKTAEAINLDNRMSEVKRDKMQIAELDAARVDKNKMDSKALDAKQALSLAQIGLSKYLADAQTVLSDKQYRLTQSLVGLQVGAGGAASKLTYKATNSQNALSSGGLAYRQPMQLSSTWSPSSARTRALQRGVASDKLLTASLNPTATSATAPGSRGMQRGVAAKSLVWGSTSRSRYRTSDNLVMQAGIEFSNPFAAKSRGAAPADRGLASESTRRIRSTRGSDPSESGDSGHLDD